MNKAIHHVLPLSFYSPIMYTHHPLALRCSTTSMHTTVPPTNTLTRSQCFNSTEIPTNN